MHLALFPDGLEALADEAVVARWARLIRLRDAVNAEIEKLRQQKIVGTSLAAKVRLEPRGDLARLLDGCRDDLPTLFITSQVELAPRGDGGDAQSRGASWSDFVESDGSGARIAVGRADGVRCERCWRFVPAVSSAPAHKGICGRCEAALADAG